MERWIAIGLIRVILRYLMGFGIFNNKKYINELFKISEKAMSLIDFNICSREFLSILPYVKVNLC